MKLRYNNLIRCNGKFSKLKYLNKLNENLGMNGNGLSKSESARPKYTLFDN
jgi:hypothetical protein